MARSMRPLVSPEVAGGVAGSGPLVSPAVNADMKLLERVGTSCAFCFLLTGWSGGLVVVVLLRG